MKITATLLLLLVLFLPNTLAQEYMQWGLPEGAVARIGKGRISRLRISPDMAQVAVVSPIGIWFYDTATGQETGLFTGQPDWITSVAFSPDGSTVAGGSKNNVYLWDIKTGEQKQVFTGHTERIHSVVFSPGGGTIASGSRDDTVRVWDAVTGEHKQTFTWTYGFGLSCSVQS